MIDFICTFLGFVLGGVVGVLLTIGAAFTYFSGRDRSVDNQSD